MHVFFQGPACKDSAIEAQLRDRGATYRRLEGEVLNETTAEALAAGQVVGWFQGRVEFSPRAPGNRSIHADPRDPGKQCDIKLRVEPIVCTPYDAYICFICTGLDLLVMGNYLIRKADQPALIGGLLLVAGMHSALAPFSYMLFRGGGPSLAWPWAVKA